MASRSSGSAGTARSHTVTDSPVGPLTLVAAAGALVGLAMSVQRHPPAPGWLGELADDQDSEPLAEASRQLTEYFDGERTEFDLPLAMEGTPFQRRVWAALLEIPYGQTVSYGQLADRIGQPSASRAVGLANGRNPIGIIVPCHRVVGADGSLTGYGGGIDRKRYLLAHEQRVSGQTLA
jgi:methylated-DNA-[protein]-cysteine S-methyltransferase